MLYCCYHNLSANKFLLSNMILTFSIFSCSLWGGSVLNLGTKKHRDKYFDGIDNLDYPGCFAMTELHHGKLLFLSLFFVNH